MSCVTFVTELSATNETGVGRIILDVIASSLKISSLEVVGDAFQVMFPINQ